MSCCRLTTRFLACVGEVHRLFALGGWLLIGLVTIEGTALPQQSSAGKPPVRGYAQTRIQERLGRGLVGVSLGKDGVYLSWRLLPSDPADAAFDVFRAPAGGTNFQKISQEPVRATTDFTDRSAKAGQAYQYQVRIHGKETVEETVTVVASAAPQDYIAIKLQGPYTFQKVGIADLNGDGRYDFVIKQPNENIDPYERYWKPSPDTYKLEAYTADGTFLWRYDLGWAIERGIWYSPYVVYDLDGDGKAEVAVKTGEGDPRDADGRVQSGPEHLTILDGLTGKVRAQVPWPSREGFGEGLRGYNYASRNQLCVAYLDGKTPCLVVNRGTYTIIKLVAYQFHQGQLQELWRWDNTAEPKIYWGQGAHWMHAADVDADGRDEVILGSAVIDDNGTALWSTGLGHPDHAYVGDIDPTRPGLEIYYGIETRQPQRNGMCLVEAATGKILWGHEGPTRHVHAHGLCSDIDARFPGSECYSADTDAQKDYAWSRLRTAQGQVISEENLAGFGPRCAYWDADPQRELIMGSRIIDYGAKEPMGRIEGALVAVADIVGDWREEIITTVPGEMRIYVTRLPARDRRLPLMCDPIYRMDVVVAAMGYYQVPMLSFDLASQGK